MSEKKNSWEARSWDELRDLISLEDIKQALLAAEKQRVYHKNAYLKKQLILERAKAAGITAD